MLATAIPTWDRDVGSLEGALGGNLKFKDCGAIPGQGVLLTVERRIKEM